jgi:hypothetical protein
MVIGSAKYLVFILLLYTVMNSISCMTSLSLTAISKELVSLKEEYPETKKRHKKKLVNAGKGTYKTKEEIEKPPSEDHPCNLTRTSVRISFPEMKGELFVNLLGYKEPNLVHLMRCKGVCGDVESPIACTATKVRQKTVKMVVKTHLHGRDKKESLKELILDEHMECGCQCKEMSASICAGKFNELTCECECEERFFGQEKAKCESKTTTYWNSRLCQCSNKSVAPRGTDSQVNTCLGSRDSENESNVPLQSYGNGFDIIGYIFLGSCITIALLLSATTIYYRRKLKKLTKTEENIENKKTKRGSWKHPNNHYSNTNGPAINFERSTSRSFESSSSSQHIANESLPIMLANELPELDDDEPYREKYDQHGVRIENQVVIDF